MLAEKVVDVRASYDGEKDIVSVVSDDIPSEVLVSRPDKRGREVYSARFWRYVPERSYAPKYSEWTNVSQTQACRSVSCECGYEFGIEERTTFPFDVRDEVELPNFCQQCGAMVERTEGKELHGC